VKGIGKVEGHAAPGKTDQAALRREDEGLVEVHLQLGVFDELLDVAAVLEHLHEVAEVDQGVASALLGLVFSIEAVGGVLVAPVGGHALLGDPVHGLRPDLHLDPHAPRAHHSRVQGPVIVPLGGRDIVLEAVRQRGPGSVGHTQGAVAVLFGIDDHPEGVDVRKL
jgi:hypothetical protein